MFVDDPPEAARVGIIRHALEHHGRGAVAQGPVDDVAVPGDPADVGRGPVDVLFAQIEYRLVRECGVDEVSARGVQHTLGLAGRSRCVQDEQRILRVHRLRLAGLGLRVHQGFVGNVARLVHGNAGSGALHDQHVLDAIGARDGQRAVDALLQGHPLAAAQSLVRRDDHRRCAVRDAAAQSLGGESRKDHRVNGPDARAREHGDGDLGNHRQIYRHPVALHDAQRLQGIRALADALVQLAVAQALRFGRIIALPDDRGLLAPCGKMAVEAVAGDVEDPVIKPADVKIGFREARVLDLRVLLDPVDAAADTAPEPRGIPHGLGVHVLVVPELDVRGGGEIFRNRIQVLVHVSPQQLASIPTCPAGRRTSRANIPR